MKRSKKEYESGVVEYVSGWLQTLDGGWSGGCGSEAGTGENRRKWRGDQGAFCSCA